jgi:glycosyltransferase involved in cell wall biosynthesis
MLEKIAYLVVREDLDGPVVQSQVVDVLASIAAQFSEPILLLWFYRVDRRIGGSMSINTLKNNFARRGIKLVALPFLAWRFPVSWYLLPLVIPQWLVGIAWVRLRYKRTIYHCRSYHSALAGIVWKKLFGGRVIFDPRSPFPEENVAAGRWNSVLNRLDYSFWKKAEKYMAQHSDRIIATSYPFCDFFQLLAPNQTVNVIPNNYSTPLPHDDESCHDEMTVGYAGSLGHWNNPKTYLQLMERLYHKNTRFKFKFILPKTSVDIFRQELVSFPLLIDKVEICSAVREKVLEELSSALVGMQIMDRPDARLGIKVVEYLAAGLPVVVSENVKGAVSIVRNFDVGIVLSETYENIDDVVDFISDVAENRHLWKLRCRRLALSMFSTEAVSKNLIDLYRTLI